VSVSQKQVGHVTQVASSQLAGQVSQQVRAQVAPQVAGWPLNWWATAVPSAG